VRRGVADPAPASSPKADRVAIRRAIGLVKKKKKPKKNGKIKKIKD